MNPAGSVYVHCITWRLSQQYYGPVHSCVCTCVHVGEGELPVGVVCPYVCLGAAAHLPEARHNLLNSVVVLVVALENLCTEVTSLTQTHR